MTSVEKNYIDRFYSMIFSETDKMRNVKNTLCLSEGDFETEKLPGSVKLMSLTDYMKQEKSDAFDLVLIIDTPEPDPQMVLLKHKFASTLPGGANIIYLGSNPQTIKLPYILSKHTLSPEDTSVVLDTYVVAQ